MGLHGDCDGLGIVVDAVAEDRSTRDELDSLFFAGIKIRFTSKLLINDVPILLMLLA